MFNADFYSCTIFIGVLLIYANHSFSSEYKQTPSRLIPSIQPRALLPEKLIVGYANWDQCDDKIIQAAKNGVNVIIWFSIDLMHNSTSGTPYINRGPNPDCVSNISRHLKELKLDVVHLISIGGWNSPHPDLRNSVHQVFTEWNRWNDHEVARPLDGFFGYDGIDWDIEGTDDVTNPQNQLTPETLDFMGQFSQLAKKSGLIVSMAPAESYMDPTTSKFDQNLTHTYLEWEPIVSNFNYHGHNPYSYLISRYGSFGSSRDPTFDFVTIQLYEGYSHALFNTTHGGQPGSQYIRNIVEKFDQGWLVDFSSVAAFNWPSNATRVEPGRLVIGLANGWANNEKFLLLPSLEICLGYKYLSEIGKGIRGFGFWNIFDEGEVMPDGKELWLAKDLDRILRIRSQNYTEDYC